MNDPAKFRKIYILQLLPNIAKPVQRDQRDLSLSDAQKVHEPSATAVKNQAQVQLQGLNLFTTLMFVLQHNIENVNYEA